MDLEATYVLKEWFKRSMAKHAAKFGFCWTGVGCWKRLGPAFGVSQLQHYRALLLVLSDRPWGQDFLEYQTGEELGTFPKTSALLRSYSSD